MIRRHLSLLLGPHFLFAFCCASCLIFFAIFFLCLPVEFVFWKQSSHNHVVFLCVCVCLCLRHRRCSFACLTLVASICLCVDVLSVCTAPNFGECFAPPSSDGSQKCFKFKKVHLQNRSRTLNIFQIEGAMVGPKFQLG